MKVVPKSLNYTYGKMADGNYIGMIDTLPGCMSYASSLGELEIRLLDAVSAYTDAISTDIITQTRKKR